MTYAGDYLPAAGDKVGDYLLLEPLGRGAMGQVYRAQDQTLGREAAIKFIDLSSLKNEKLIEEVKKRFLREARVLAAINHPNVVAIYTASLNFRCPYIAMEYFPGKPLFEFQDEFGVIDYKRCCLISLQICEALDYCWENYQVMHRDLKPANILIGDGGHIKIIDWGIAKVTKDLALGISLATRSDMRLGTPHFMAPEQQLNPSEVTYVADIYSMGVIMWQMLVGSPPFDANSEAVLYSQKIKGPTQKLGDLVPDLPPALEELIGRMMEPDPQKRISSYAEIRSILQREINKFEDISELFPKKKETQVPKLRPLPQFQGKRSPKKRYDGGTQPMEIQGLTRKEEEPTQAVSSPQKKLLIIKKPHETGPATPIPPKKVKLTKSGSIPATELSPPAAPAPPPKKVKLTKSGSIAVDPAQDQPGSPQPEPEAQTVTPPPPASPQPPSPQPPASSEPERSPLSEALRSTASLRFQPLPDIRLINSKLHPDMELGEYRLIERLGSGATGVVYRAEDRQKTQLYLVKVMISNPSDLRRRWNSVLDYLGAYCQCEHRALAALVDVQVQQGFFTLVSYPYLGSDGRPVNLLQASRIYGNHQGLLNQFDVRGIALILLEALQKLHLRNILHMNIKPSNVLFPASANQAMPQWYAGLKLTDAGTPYFIGMQYYGKLIRKALPYYCAPNRMKPDIHSLIQSYDFMAPELKRGEEARPESDLYSLAMLILWALTGIPHLCIQARPSRMRSGVDPAWDPIFFKALQENPARRYQSADEMAADIAALPF